MVSSRTSKSPAFTVAPDSKAISTTVPAISGVIVTPCTAVREPTALNWLHQLWGWTCQVVTVSGGGTNCFPWSIILPICRALMPARMP